MDKNTKITLAELIKRKEQVLEAKKNVKRSVISTQDAEKLEAVFVTEDRKESIDGPVHIKDELPVYLL